MPKRKPARYDNPTYRPLFLEAVRYIARNDNPGDDDSAVDLASYVSVGLVADLFEAEPSDVAMLVYTYRRLIENEG